MIWFNQSSHFIGTLFKVFSKNQQIMQTNKNLYYQYDFKKETKTFKAY